MLRVHEIFESIQGEGFNAGRPAVFLRLQGCNLRCPWCDEPKALTFNATPEVSEEALCKQLVPMLTRTGYLVLTGGEPTAQDCSILMRFLRAFFPTLDVSIETNGTLPFRSWMDDAWITLSPKTKAGGKSPSAGMIRMCDEVKLVVEADTDIRKEYDFYRANGFNQIDYPWFQLMPEDGQREQVLPKIIDFVMKHPTEARVCLRLHKLLKVK